MNQIVEQCRSEWRRLHVPEAIADEMAAELAADLEEAAANGVDAEEVLGLGASDPRSLAAAWAQERGLVEVRLFDRLRNHRRLLLAVAGAIAGSVGLSVGLVEATGGSPAPDRVTVPILLHHSRAVALQRAKAAGFHVQVTVRKSGKPAGKVVFQTPAPGQIAPPGSTITIAMTPAQRSH